MFPGVTWVPFLGEIQGNPGNVRELTIERMSLNRRGLCGDSSVCESQVISF